MAMPLCSPLATDLGRWLLPIVIGLELSGLAPAAHAEATAQPEPADQFSPDSAMSREAWKERVQQARERAERARRDAAAQPREMPSPPPSPEERATDRILSDETLQSGDVIVTSKGSFVFRGRTDAGQLILQPLSPRP
ncbi:hypothetical protein SSBR45G_16850 [Bradyrhizobium sp. SSBR45G]|uniref:hypothetical protein n=1 Tax=unclassified Bradyrhizobium TaxID=2631580 RepID=UPI002342A8B9|nr:MULTISPECIES: hypothetical protein [unclassified Bradyrhizobium]GLH76777.1 hypothetical protein SSBR45G_16850 [Bradyrhizobium sp. SSBR45G]GLH83535.1 hypothetical protein SSBR45R_09950 [Bradyrhizobium sp. SSBR45R]